MMTLSYDLFLHILSPNTHIAKAKTSIPIRRAMAFLETVA